MDAPSPAPAEIQTPPDTLDEAIDLAWDRFEETLKDWPDVTDHDILAAFVARAQKRAEIAGNAATSFVRISGVDDWTLNDLRRCNADRQETWCPGVKPDLSFRGNELAGEVGEACNLIKKLERARHGWKGSTTTKERLAEELGDVIICADLVALTAGVDLKEAVKAKFDMTSEANGLPQRLLASSGVPAVDTVKADVCGCAPTAASAFPKWCIIALVFMWSLMAILVFGIHCIFSESNEDREMNKLISDRFRMIHEAGE